MSWQVGLYATAVLIPLAAFAVEAIFIRQLKRLNAYIATGAIAFSCLLSLIGFLSYAWESSFFSHRAESQAAETEAGTRRQPPSRPCRRSERRAHHKPLVWSREFRLGRPGSGLPSAERGRRRRPSPTWSFLWASRSTT